MISTLTHPSQSPSPESSFLILPRSSHDCHQRLRDITLTFLAFTIKRHVPLFPRSSVENNDQIGRRRHQNSSRYLLSSAIEDLPFSLPARFPFLLWNISELLQVTGFDGHLQCVEKREGQVDLLWFSLPLSSSLLLLLGRFEGPFVSFSGILVSETPVRTCFYFNS